MLGRTYKKIREFIFKRNKIPCCQKGKAYWQYNCFKSSGSLKIESTVLRLFYTVWLKNLSSQIPSISKPRNEIRYGKKTTDIVAYITWIGLLVALIAGDRKDEKFHLNQCWLDLGNFLLYLCGNGLHCRN